MIISRWTSTLSGTIAAASAVLLAACGSSSTSPKGETAAQVSAYYDALAGTHLAAGTAADTIDAEFIGLFNGPIAYGQLPTQIAVSASGTSATWYADAVLYTDSAQTDSARFIFLWADTTVSAFMLGEADTALENADFYTASGASAGADSSTVTLTGASKSGSCANNPITHTYSVLPTYDPADLTCTPATITLGGHLHFQAANGIASQFQDIDLASTTIAAVRLQSLHGSAFERVRKMPHGIIRVR